jgi:hypothetical protein
MKISLPGCVALLGAVTTFDAHAWGQFKNLNMKWHETVLTYVAITRHNINVCVDIAAGTPPEFSEDSIYAQTKMALSLWLDSIRAATHADVTVRRVACSAYALDLKIKVGPTQILNTREIPVEAFTGFAVGNKQPFALVRLDTSFHFAGSADTMYDLGNIVNSMKPIKPSMGEAMESANAKKMTTRDFAILANVDDVLTSSTYPVLIHELGHAFGLCDTNDEDFLDHCDLQWVSSSESQPDSVMKTASFLYLTSDDIEGIQSLVRRFAQSAPTEPQSASSRVPSKNGKH